MIRLRVGAVCSRAVPSGPITFVVTYRINSPIVGVEQSSTRMLIIPIAAGTMLRVPDVETGSVQVAYQGREVSVFVRDLLTRGERVEDQNLTPLG